MDVTSADVELLQWAKTQDYRSASQRTIARSVSFSGVSMVDGRTVNVSLHPAEPGTGLVFRRTDLEHRPEIPARLKNICRSSIYIALTHSGWREGLVRKFLRNNTHLTPFRYLEHLLLPLPRPHVAVVEHFLAVAYIFVDNLIIDVDGDDLPYMSFQEYALRFKEADVVEQAAERKMFTVAKEFRSEGREGQFVEIHPGKELFVEYSIDFSQKSSAVGIQSHTISLTPDTFMSDISRARTLFLIKWRRFVKGIYKSVEYSPKSLSKILAADGNSYLNTGADTPRYIENGFSTEVVRHKIGDLLGEMALTGIPLLGRFRIHRGGHHFTLQALKEIIESGLLQAL